MAHDFSLFKTAIARQFERMQHGPNAQLYRVDVEPDALWAAYLAAFPPGTNPIYRERTEYDCSCCRQFVRTLGGVVGIAEGALISIWDVMIPGEPAYQAVASALAAIVGNAGISSPFLHYEKTVGTDRNFEELTGLGGEVTGTRTWNHFHVNLDKRFVRAKDQIPTAIGERRAAHDVLLRSLREISDDAIDTTLDLIGQNSLYRGEEHRGVVEAFRALRREFGTLSDPRAQDIFAWTKSGEAGTSGAVARIRNTAIGTLLVDLSEGAMDLEAAVRSFEAKVAPTNYKRPSSLVTKAMIEKAKATIESLGLTSALDRRYARMTDISIGDLLFADRGTRATLTGDVFDDLAASAPMSVKAAKSLDKIEEVPVDRFIAEIVPRAESIEVLFEGKLAGNLVSLIAPVDPTACALFKWDNGFSWSYNGEVADAIKERVKKAGGNVTGDLCCRLAWFNFDDLDLHMKEPGGAHGYEIYFGTRHSASPGGGRLDVDMNVSPTTREAVENIFYASRAKMREGEYHLFVNQYNARESKDVGFEVEIDYLGDVQRFAYAKPVRGNVTVARFKYTHKGGMEIIESLPGSEASRTIWGLTTGKFHRVSAMLLSPNHWDGAKGASGHGVGNRHFMFMVDGCRNDGGARGFYNEFLSEALTPHRKVFEVVAAKMKPADSAEQLSGLGFSSTSRNSIVVKVKGSFTRTIRVVI